MKKATKKRAKKLGHTKLAKTTREERLSQAIEDLRYAIRRLAVCLACDFGCRMADLLDEDTVELMFGPKALPKRARSAK